MKKDKKSKEVAPTTSISGCTFIGAKYDAKAGETITMIAAGLAENAKALGKLAEVLKASNVTIESMIRVETGKGEE